MNAELLPEVLDVTLCWMDILTLARLAGVCSIYNHQTKVLILVLLSFLHGREEEHS